MSPPNLKVRSPDTGFRGMRYVIPQTPWDRDYLWHALDALPVNGIYQPRAGDLGVATGAGVNVPPQGVAQFRTATGNSIDLMVAGGEIYTRGPANAWTKVITSANLTTASITLATSGRVYAVPFSLVVIISDGTNTPFQWNGTTNGGLTSLTNAPVAYGPPTVYYAKVFLVKNANRDTIVWSEEGTANTGYEAGGFSNAWQLRQTGGGTLTRIWGSNEGLYYFRATSIGIIRGAVGPDFTAAGTHSDVSTELGTTAPLSVIEVGEWVWFTDARGLPWRFRPGADPEPVWQNIAAIFPGLAPGAANSGLVIALDTSAIPKTVAAPFHHHGLVAIGFFDNQVLSMKKIFAFDAKSGQAVCELNPFADASGAAFLTHLIGAGEVYGESAHPGFSFYGLNPQSASANAVFTCPTSAAATPRRAVFTTGPLELPGAENSYWRRVRIKAPTGVLAPLTSVELKATDGLHLSSLSIVPGVKVISSPASKPQDVTLTWGIKRRQPWLQVCLSAGLTGNLALRSVELEGYPAPVHPAATDEV